MDYIDDLNNNIAKADKLVEELIKARTNGWDTVYDLCDNSLRAILNSVRHCIRCANKKLEKRNHKYKFKCSGGCARGGSFENFDKLNKDLLYFLQCAKRRSNG